MTDAISMMLSAGQAKVQHGVAVAMVRQQRQADQTLLDMMQTAIEAAPAPGTGTLVDKRA